MRITTDDRRWSEAVVAAALLKAFSAEISAESRIMLGRYSRQIAFQKQEYRIIQTAFELNTTPEAVDDPDMIWETAELMGANCEELFSVHVLSEELYHSIVYLTGAVFDYGEIVEQVALRCDD